MSFWTRQFARLFSSSVPSPAPPSNTTPAKPANSGEDPQKPTESTARTSRRHVAPVLQELRANTYRHLPGSGVSRRSGLLDTVIAPPPKREENPDVLSCLTPEQQSSVQKMSEVHRAYLFSQSGQAELKQAKANGREIDFDKFAKLPETLFGVRPEYPTPLFLLAHNFEVHKLSVHDYKEALTNALECNLFDMHRQGWNGWNPLGDAIAYSNTEAFNAFIACDKETNENRPEGLALNAVSKNGSTPLENAIHMSGAQGSAIFVTTLITAGADLTSPRHPEGLVHLAMRTLNPEIVDWVTTASLASGILYSKDERGQTPEKARVAAERRRRAGGQRGGPGKAHIKEQLRYYKNASNKAGRDAASGPGPREELARSTEDFPALSREGDRLRSINWTPVPLDELDE